jgi:hypothetical protein
MQRLMRKGLYEKPLVGTRAVRENRAQRVSGGSLCRLPPERVIRVQMKQMKRARYWTVILTW